MWAVNSTPIAAENGGTLRTYGVSVGDTEVSDVSLCKSDIENFVEKLNRLGASEIHTLELVEDFLGK